MNRYPSYKPSGVKWLGEIPSHWEVRKNKYLFRESDERNVDRQYQLLSFSKSKGIIPYNETSDKENSAEDLSNYKVLHIGQLLENRLQAWNGMFACSKIDGCVSPDYSVFNPNGNDVNVDYYAYLFRTILYIEQWANASKGVGSGFNRLYTPQFGSICSIFPPKEEQDAIVAYLNEKNAKIDAAIAQQQKMIDLLNERKQIIINRAVTKGLNPNAKMKDSGVEWIGEVPEGWKIIPLKAIISFVNGYAFDSNDFKDEGEVKVIRISNIADGTIDYEGIAFVHQNQSLCPYLTKAGDLLIAMSGATTGKVGFDDLGGAYVNQRVGIIRSDFQKWVYYWLNTSYFKEYIYLSALGSAQPNISSKGIKNFRILFPSIEDYDRIVENLELLCQKVDNAIGSCKNQISLLQERKQIIINEVVTGKVKVI